MAYNNFKKCIHLVLPLFQLAAAQNTTLSTFVVPATSTSSVAYIPTPSTIPNFETPRNFTTLTIAVYPNSLSLNGSLCNATQTPELKTVSYFVRNGWAIIDGDIIFGTEAQIQAASVSNTQVVTRDMEDITKRSMSLYPQDSGKWPGGRILYKWGTGLDNGMKNDFLAAAKLWTDRLPFLQFIEDNGPNSRTINGVSGCTSSSHVGRVSGGGVIEIGDCRSVGVVAHEIGHTLGLKHEQKRPDRDFYININCEEIEAPRDCTTTPWTGNANQFWMESPTAFNWAGPYDVNSIMHYEAYTYARGSIPVITGKPGITFKSSGRDEPSLQDARHVCELYWEDCHSICGDGILSPQFEECEDGNNVNGDSCNSDCKIPPPAACVGTCVPGVCGTRATCEVFNPFTSAAHFGDRYCVCQAGYRATGIDATNTDQQYRMTWKNAFGDQTHRVFVKPGQDCTEICTDVNCSQVPLKDTCR